MHSDEGLLQPDIQLYFSPLSYTRAPSKTRPLMNPDPFSAFSLGFSNCRVKSEGGITLSSSDPFVAPIIDPKYFSDDRDLAVMLKGLKLLRKIARSAAFKTIISQELSPDIKIESDAQLIDYIKENAWTVFHPTSTCRMGPDPIENVVDAQLKVHGIENLRVCDASIMPLLISGNTNAPTIMIAEKGADLILEDWARKDPAVAYSTLILAFII